MDIKGALICTSNVEIKQQIIGHEIPEALVDWIQNILVGRNVIFYQRYKTTEGTQDRGCPMGDALSPLLSCLVVNGLLEDLQKEGIHVYGYADDIAIVVTGHFLTTLRNLMENALKITHK